MKKKLTVNSLALGNLKQRKKQYTIMIIGIILAMTFTSGVLFSLFSLGASNREMAKNSFGNQDMILCNTTTDFVETAVQDGIIGEYGYSHTIGYAYTDENEYENGTSIAWLDDKAKELSYQSLLEGEYPVNENEIALEKVALIKLGLDAKIGDKITLTILPQDVGEYIEKPTQKSYTLVGILRDKRVNLCSDSYYMLTDKVPAAFVCQGTQTELGGKEKLGCYFRLAGYTGYTYSYNLYDKFINYMRDKSVVIDGLDDNLIEINRTNHSSGRTAGGLEDNILFTCLLGGVLMIASCLAIINAFNTNLKERKKQIGMLRAVGTTKRQIIKIFGREAFIIALICTPISTVLSYLMVFALSGILGDDFVIAKSLWVLLVCAAVSVLIVMLAALIPLIAATKITPMQAIRNIDINRKMKNKKIKSQNSFSVPKLLAKRNMTFYKGGRIAVSFMLIVTIAASCFGFSAMKYSKEHAFYSYPFDYELDVRSGYIYEFANYESIKTGISDNERREIEASPYVADVYGIKECTANLMLDEFTDYFKIVNGASIFDYGWDQTNELTRENFVEYMKTQKSERYQNVISQFGYSQELMPTNIYAVDETQLKLLEGRLIDGEINYAKLSSGEEIILCAPQKAMVDVEIKDGGFGGWGMEPQYDEQIDGTLDPILEGECPYKAGDKIDISILDAYNLDEGGNVPTDAVRTDKEITIGAIILPTETRHNDNFLAAMYDDFSFITSISGINHFSENRNYKRLFINAQAEVDENIENEIMSILQPLCDKTNGYVTSNYNIAQLNKQSLNTTFISMLALIILGFTICASIVNNSLTARIRESKRELGTLRAVGVSQADLVNAYVRQLLSIFSWGYGIGFGVFLIGYLIEFLGCKLNEETTMSMIFSPWITILFCAVLFAICSINLWLKIKKEMKNSIIDNIREL